MYLKTLTNTSEQNLMNRETVVRLQPVFALLRESTELSRRKQIEPWQYAVEITELYSLGAGEDDLARLVAAGLAQHGIETTIGVTRPRTFIPGGCTFGPKSCMVLSHDGIVVMKEAGIENKKADGQIQLKPIWNAEKNELRLAGQLVKRFRWHAPNQERLITAFAEGGWPEKIDDPLPRDEMVDAKRRLHDTIKCLNRRHVQDIMRFHGDGSGQGVIWRISKPCSPKPR